jgi:SatD family (SatD)
MRSEEAGHRRKLAAVMGDLIGSEKAASMRLLHDQFNAALAETSVRANAIASPLTITLGDEFQGLFYTLTDGLSAVKFMRQRLLANGVPCRFALGIVELDSPLNVERAWNMMGAGFAEIREKINDKKSQNAYRFYLPENNCIEILLEAVGYSISSVEQTWTKRQQAVMSLTGSGGFSVKELASKLKVTERNIYKIRTSSQYDFLANQWHSMESVLAQIDTEAQLK